MKIYLQTLTPLHIGTGEEYQLVDYVVENQRFYKIDSTDFEKFIGKFPNSENVFLKYIEWIDKHVEALQADNVRRNNLLATYKNRDFNFRAFAQSIGKRQEYNDWLNTKASYPVFGTIYKKVKELMGANNEKQYYIAGSSIKGAVRTALLHHVYNRLVYTSEVQERDYAKELQERIESDLAKHLTNELPLDKKLASLINILKSNVDRLHKDSPKKEILQKIEEKKEIILSKVHNREAYKITMSEILSAAGVKRYHIDNAMRTMNHDIVFAKLEKLGQRANGAESYNLNKKQQENLAKDLETSVEFPLYCGYIDDRGAEKYDSEYYDICKFLQITDAQIAPNMHNEAPLQVWQTQRFNKKLFKDKEIKTYTIELQRSSNPLITWRKSLVWKFEIEIQLIQILRIYENISAVNERKIWIGFEEKIKDFFGIDITALTTELAFIFDKCKKMERIAEVQRESEVQILETIHSFYNQVLRFEKKWFENEIDGFDYDSLRFENAFSKSYADNWEDKKLMRMAFAAGFPAHTELLIMLEGKENRALMRKIMKSIKIGNKPQNQDDYIPNLEDFPKSRLLACNGTQSAYPLGWVQLFAEGEEANISPIEMEEPSEEIPEKEHFSHKEDKKPEYVPEVRVTPQKEKGEDKKPEEKITAKTHTAEEAAWEDIIDNKTHFKAKVIDADKKIVHLLIKDKEIIAQLQMGTFKSVALQTDQIVSVMCKQRTKSGEIKQVSYQHFLEK